MAKHTSDLAERAQASADFLKSRVSESPRIAMILGSGLGAIGDQLDEATAIDYADIPHFPVSGVEGHKGRLVFGKLEGVPVVVMQGRSHFYEGWTMQEVTFPVRAFHLMGIDHLVVTNSAGGINADYAPGDLMIICDQVNFTGQNPLHGPNEDAFGPRFPDMSDPYAKELRELLHAVASEEGIAVKEGVYAGVAGPSYETPAEVRMLRTMGGDAVGMSTVPEVIVANHCGMKVAGISCITNYAAGLSDTKLHHDEVKETADRVRETFTGLVRGLVKVLGKTL
ncbi:purine-nucleoside phosphorylase [Lujinxingia vulgaris]|uniref:Purine nucleoside phosphorylase n=1 Tax=Lujinxingia vulgaris TaxID=2600176 RepID=A0A5C6X475_9DELT|nr:purine-nucleoside phosphorylase [Lujinxingia vulgaris]TXD35917.1 purine-nucleoside phosphorylase [Lujinxingia vulgaris]